MVGKRIIMILYKGTVLKHVESTVVPGGPYLYKGDVTTTLGLGK